LLKLNASLAQVDEDQSIALKDFFWRLPTPVSSIQWLSFEPG
jgi:hypothetical protein